MKRALIEAFLAFLEVEEDKSIASTEVIKRASLLTVSRIIYNYTDWAVAGALASFSFWMQAKDVSTTGVYVGTSLYDFFAAAGFFFLSDMTGCDFTLGRSFRRVSDSFRENGFWGLFFSAILLFGLAVKAIIWEGPEVICVLFRRELNNRKRIWSALFILSALQGIFGTWLYTTGYNLCQKYVPAELQSHYILLGIATFIIFVIIVAILRKVVQWSIRAVKFFFRISRKEKLLIAALLVVMAFDGLLVWLK